MSKNDTQKVNVERGTFVIFHALTITCEIKGKFNFKKIYANLKIKKSSSSTLRHFLNIALTQNVLNTHTKFTNSSRLAV